MIILDFYINVCHCSHTLSVTKVVSYIYCCRRAVRVGNGGAKLPFFALFMAPLIVNSGFDRGKI